MTGGSDRALRGVPAMVLVALGALGGCASREPLEAAGVAVRPPDGWSAAPRTRWAVVGTPLAAWSGPGGSSFVVFRSLAEPGARAEALARLLTHRVENLPGVRVVSSRVETVAGLEAARVELVAPGTGDAFAPSGSGAPTSTQGAPLLPTRRVVYLIPRESDTLHLLWHAPDADAPALEAQVQAALKSLKIDRGRLSVNSY